MCSGHAAVTRVRSRPRAGRRLPGGYGLTAGGLGGAAPGQDLEVAWQNPSVFSFLNGLHAENEVQTSKSAH